jgi:hypothetical protein
MLRLKQKFYGGTSSETGEGFIWARSGKSWDGIERTPRRGHVLGHQRRTGAAGAQRARPCMPWGKCTLLWGPWPRPVRIDRSLSGITPSRNRKRFMLRPSIRCPVIRLNTVAAACCDGTHHGLRSALSVPSSVVIVGGGAAGFAAAEMFSAGAINNR